MKTDIQTISTKLRTLSDEALSALDPADMTFEGQPALRGELRRRETPEYGALRAKQQQREQEYEAIWGTLVRSIGPGEIIDCRDGHPDNPKPGVKLPFCDGPMTSECRAKDPSGNFVTVRVDTGEEVKYAHLRIDSLTEMEIYPRCKTEVVRVNAGTRLGRVGNSGNSDGPHLHIGVLRKDADLAALPHCGKSNGEDTLSHPLVFDAGKAVHLDVLQQHPPGGGEAIPWADIDGHALGRDIVVEPP